MPSHFSLRSQFSQVSPPTAVSFLKTAIAFFPLCAAIMAVVGIRACAPHPADESPGRPVDREPHLQDVRNRLVLVGAGRGTVYRSFSMGLVLAGRPPTL